MKRFILILAIVLVVAATPLFAKDSDAFLAVGCDVTLPATDFFKVFRGDAALSFGYIGSAEKDLYFGLYSFNTLRVPLCTYDNQFGFNKNDLSELTEFYFSGIEGVDIAIPLASKLNLVVGLGLFAELDWYCSWNDSPVLGTILGELGAGARVDLVFNLSDSFFLDFGVEGSYLFYEYCNFLDLKEQDFYQVSRWDYPSCGLRAGIKF